MESNWTKVEVTGDKFELPDDFKGQKEIFIFMSRDMIEKGYDLSKVTLQGQPLIEVDSTFNLTSSEFKALFLVGKFDLKEANTVSYA